MKLYNFESRKARTGEPVELSWEGLKQRLEATKRTSETQEEFFQMSKDEQGEIKDVGGFVFANLKDGRRGKGFVESVNGIVLDADFASQELIDEIELLSDFCSVVYSTHKHRPEAMRLRWIIPTSRQMTPEESEAVGRKIAEEYGMKYFDMTTFQPSRLMYWPSTSKDGEYIFETFENGDFLNPDEWLKKYKDHTDHTQWPHGKDEKVPEHKEQKMMEDPLTKKGPVGAFCRTYSISEAIDAFLVDQYTPTDDPNRYTYKGASTSGGLVVYDDKYAHSYHETDPISGRSVNAYDLVRIHQFGEGKDSAQNFNRWLWEECSKYRNQWRKENEKKTEVKEEKQEKDWQSRLITEGKDCHFKNCQTNLLLILNNDPRLKGLGVKNELTAFPEKTGQLPKPWWKDFNSKDTAFHDSDVTLLESYIEETWGIFSSFQKVSQALDAFHDQHSYHPVRQYLDSVEWDGRSRVETLLCDYFGAEDNEYTRAVTKKFLSGAVARVYEPGIKFDYMLVLVGDAGAGKSTFLRKLAGNKFYTSSLKAGNNKDAYDSLRGYWIGEFEEMTAFQKISEEDAKQFISKQTDSYRPAYGRFTIEYKRQIVFTGSTNRHEFLQDHTGNRRYWPVDVTKGKHNKSVFDDLDQERDQIWAEAVALYQMGEPLYLEDEKVEKLAELEQQRHTSVSVKQDALEDYLETLLPESWGKMSAMDRMDWLRKPEEERVPEGTEKRKKTSPMEIWIECFGGNKKEFHIGKQREIQAYLEHLGWAKNGTRYRSQYGRFEAYVQTKEDD